MKKYIAIFVGLFLVFISGQAASVDTVLVYSHSMNKSLKTVVISPDGYGQMDSVPVLYLLHGYSGDYADWVKKSPGVKLLADRFNVLIVCPDGGFDSWYFDSPKDMSIRYESYISKELVDFVDHHYATIKSRKGRAITGLSMGGHGALYLAFKHQDVFGAAGSMSGGVDLRPFPNNWSIKEVLGSYDENKELWENNTVINLTHLLTPGSLAIIFDCGTGDFFFEANKALHEKLRYLNIQHDYIVRPGSHSWAYWANSIKYQMMFFSDFFNR